MPFRALLQCIAGISARLLGERGYRQYSLPHPFPPSDDTGIAGRVFSVKLNPQIPPPLGSVSVHQKF
jgi:hypothetical protein